MIGLTGSRGVGKSTIADILVDKYGYSRIHIFNGGKAMAAAYYRHCGASEDEAERMINGDLKDVPSPYLPGMATSRLFMEKLGKWMPNTMGVEWTIGKEVELALKRDRDAKLLAESLVYEPVWLRANGGIVIRVERPGHAGPVGVESDAVQAEIEADYTIVNDGGLDDLESEVDYLMEIIDQ